MILQNDFENYFQKEHKALSRDLKAMEFALIQEHKPKYNFAGRSQPYQF